MAEQIAWSVGGHAVAMEWNAATMVDHGGFDSFAGSFPWSPWETRANPFPTNWAPGVAEDHTGNNPVATMQVPSWMRQGQIVVGKRANGQTLWKGVVRQTPRLKEGRAEIVAEGFKVLAERANERLPYQIADASAWSMQTEQPINSAGTNPDLYRLESKKDSLTFVVQKSETYAVGDQNGYALLVDSPDGISRVRFTHRTNGGANNWDIETRGLTALGASATLIDNYAWNTADGTTKNIDTSGGNYVAIILRVKCTTNATPAASRRAYLDDVRVNGTSLNGDVYTGADIAGDIASRLGWRDKTSSGAINIMPLDWTGQWSDLLDYLAQVEDFCWLVLDDPQGRYDAALYFREYGAKSWTTSLDLIADESLVIPPLYNRSTTYFERPRGALGHRTGKPSDFGLKDPLAGSAINYPYPEPLTLGHPQRATTLADAINEKVLRRFTKYRLQGSLTVAGLLAGGVPFDMRAGDLLTIGDFVPPVGPQRIAAIDYRSDGTAQVSLDRIFDLSDMLVRMRNKVRPHRR